MMMMMMMMNRRITPVGPVVAMAYVHKVVSEENFVEVKMIGEAFDKKVEGMNSTHKSSTMDYQLFPADENVKQTELNGMSPSTKAGDSFKISSSVIEMKDISPALAASESLNDDSKDIQFQSPSPQLLVTKETGGSVANEYKKVNSCQLSQTLNGEENVVDSLQETVPQVETKHKSWVELFKPKPGDHNKGSKLAVHNSDSKHAVHTNGSNAVSKISLAEKKTKPAKEEMVSQIRSDGWSECKTKKNKRRKSAMVSNSVTG